MNEKLVSIIMPAYNSERFIGEAIDSVLNQTYKNWELIIVDDFSQDDTRQIIESYSKLDPRIINILLSENKGAANARNKAIDKSTGEYLAFLDSDDIWLKEKLKVQIEFMEKNDYGFTSTSYNKIDENGNDLNKIISTEEVINYEDLLKKCPGNSTVVYNVSKIGKIFIPNIRKRNDYVMWLKVIKKEKMHGILEIMSSHRLRSGAISSNKFDLVRYHWHVYRSIENLSIIKSVWLVMYWSFVTVFKLR